MYFCLINFTKFNPRERNHINDLVISLSLPHQTKVAEGWGRVYV